MALGDTLISKGLITTDQLELALAEQKKYPGEKIGEILIRMGFVTKQQVDGAL